MFSREGKGNRPAWLLGGGIAALALAASADAALVTISDVVTNTTATTQSYFGGHPRQHLVRAQRLHG